MRNPIREWWANRQYAKELREVEELYRESALQDVADRNVPATKPYDTPYMHGLPNRRTRRLGDSLVRKDVKRAYASARRRTKRQQAKLMALAARAQRSPNGTAPAKLQEFLEEQQ